MRLERTSGILLHPTSLPGRYGIGDIGPAAFEFVDFLNETAQSVWQVLPLCPTGFGNSPYLAYSALAGNPLLVSPDRLQEAGWLTADDLTDLPDFPTDRVDFGPAIDTKFQLLRRAFKNFLSQGGPESAEFQEYCRRNNDPDDVDWLDDFALFIAIKNAHGGRSWHQWEPDIARRDPEAMQSWRDRLGEELTFWKF